MLGLFGGERKRANCGSGITIPQFAFRNPRLSSVPGVPGATDRGPYRNFLAIGYWLSAIFQATRFAIMKPSPPDPRQFSAEMIDGPERAVSRGMLYAVGFKKEDFAKPIVGIASTWSQVTPCNVHIDQLARAAAAGADAADAKSLIFNTVTVSDGISMGTEGMKYSLVSREVIADSIETVPDAKALTESLPLAAATRTCRVV